MLSEIANGVKLLGVGVTGFFAGSIGWAAVSGVIGGVLDSFGVVIPGSTYLALSPVAGVALAGHAASKVMG